MRAAALARACVPKEQFFNPGHKGPNHQGSATPRLSESYHRPPPYPPSHPPTHSHSHRPSGSTPEGSRRVRRRVAEGRTLAARALTNILPLYGLAPLGYASTLAPHRKTSSRWVHVTIECDCKGFNGMWALRACSPSDGVGSCGTADGASDRMPCEAPAAARLVMPTATTHIPQGNPLRTQHSTLLMSKPPT